MRRRAVADPWPGHEPLVWKRIAKLEHGLRSELLEQAFEIHEIAARLRRRSLVGQLPDRQMGRSDRFHLMWLQTFRWGRLEIVNVALEQTNHAVLP